MILFFGFLFAATACNGNPGPNPDGGKVVILPDPIGPDEPRQSGPYTVGDRVIYTRAEIEAGSTVHITASGLVDFGGAFLGTGQVIKDAEGDDWQAPDDYPAPDLKKNSLICKVGNLYYQGGVDTYFTPMETGELILRPNDADLTDNSRSWEVMVEWTPPED